MGLPPTGSGRPSPGHRGLGCGASGTRGLATNLTAPLATIGAFYDRRMAIEEQLRDTKGCRFGLKREWTQFRTPQHLVRLTLLVGVALVL